MNVLTAADCITRSWGLTGTAQTSPLPSSAHFSGWQTLAAVCVPRSRFYSVQLVYREYSTCENSRNAQFKALAYCKAFKRVQRGGPTLAHSPFNIKCRTNYAMYSNPELSNKLNSFFCLSLTLYQYLKCDLSLAFQSGWLLRCLHWKVAGLVKRQKKKKKPAIENVIFVVKLNFVKKMYCT